MLVLLVRSVASSLGDDIFLDQLEAGAVGGRDGGSTARNEVVKRSACCRSSRCPPWSPSRGGCPALNSHCGTAKRFEFQGGGGRPTPTWRVEMEHGCCFLFETQMVCEYTLLNWSKGNRWSRSTQSRNYVTSGATIDWYSKFTHLVSVGYCLSFCRRL